MPKRPNKRTAEFFETLAGNAPETLKLPSAEQLRYRIESIQHSLVGAWKSDTAREIMQTAIALSHDVRHYSWAALRTTTGPTARRVYRVVAASTAAAVIIAGLVVANATYVVYANNLATPQTILNNKNTGTTILDRNGAVLYRANGANNRQVVNLSDVPQSLQQATLAAEDPNFYNEPGVSIRGSLRATYEDLTNHNLGQGGSTITQQLVKNALLNDNKSFLRKYQEIVLALDVNARYNKDQILQMYLNEIYYGEDAYGIEAASETYFHEPAKNLDLSQSALLAGLPQAPSQYDPNTDLAAATTRRDYVLDRMQQLGYITTAEDAKAKAEPVRAYPEQAEIHAPWFVFYVLDQLRQQYGDNLVKNGGITVYTTLDLKKEEAAETIVHNQIQNLIGRHVTNGGLVSIDPNTGDILAMVGSYDWNNPDYGNVNVTTSTFQPGSSFKPFAYVTAFEKGWTGATTVVDAPISLPNGDGTMYTPQNYDLKWHGTVTLRHALDNSLNIPAIKVLQYAGIPDTLKTASSMGITTLGDPSQYGLSLVLGSGDVEPLQMAEAYGVFANGGNKVQPRAIIKVLDKQGSDITKPINNAPQQVLDPRYAYMITNILSDNSARQPEFPVNSPLKLSRPAAAKTGTTNDFRDNWTIGYTPDVVTAVWVGNNDHSPMGAGVDGITGAAPIWHDYMEMALAGTPVHDFSVPAGIQTARVCAHDGGLANPWDNQAYDEIFLAGQVETRHCGTSNPTPPPPPQPQPAAQPNQDNNQNLNPAGGMGNGSAPVNCSQTPTAPSCGTTPSGNGGTGGGNMPPICTNDPTAAVCKPSG